MSTTAPPTVVEAAGAVVWRVRTGRLQVALVHRPRYRDWSWPKGKVDPGESVVTAAWREVAEETGDDVVLGVPLAPLEYPLSDGRLKRVHYWAAQVSGRVDGAALRARPPVPRASRDEIDQVRWFDVDAAAARLTRAADRAPLVELVAAHAKDRLDSRAVVVARHGSARRRSTWKGGESDRPLTPTGAKQAEELVPIVSAFGVGRVVSSPWLRCVDTAAPYASAAQVPLELVPHLSESGNDASPARVAATVLDLLQWPGDSLVCTHRPVLPTVVDVLAQHTRRQVADSLPQQDPFLRPAELLVAHVVQTAKGPRVVAAEMHRPPVPA
ncbi:NUDIX hydrolase [Cellulomonas composti]|uniref:ADP-ribose pyrophosphatase n=1 Tax=Cellulomonas composti TaxID=266130 RepID=A0A511JDH4_9CELL|nr:NUDIX hydrolase [Cellulomonas composti]GEL95773.1 ADP-ribose pyrophosphatase [Cellulomonas composti]